MPKIILSIAREQILLETRGAVLRKTGHRVVSVSSPEEFREYVAGNAVDLVVLGHSLSRTDREQVYEILRESHHLAPVIELYATPGPPKTSAHFLLAVHDQTFEADLLALVRQVLSSTPN